LPPPSDLRLVRGASYRLRVTFTGFGEHAIDFYDGLEADHYFR
jgi:hypothetical protein